LAIAGALAGFGAGLFYLSNVSQWNPLNSTSLPGMGLGKIGVLTQVQSTGVAHVVHRACTVLVDELIHQIQADPLAAAVAVLIWVVLNKTTFGYELKAVGLNKNAARYAGINEKKNRKEPPTEIWEMNSAENTVPMGLELASSATEIPLKPMPGRLVEFSGFHVGHIGQIEQTCAEACQRTGNGHGEDDVLLLVDTGIAGGVLVQANSPTRTVQALCTTCATPVL